MEYKPCNLVVEGCCNHGGSLETAKEMTLAAHTVGAGYIKWQKRNPKESVPKDWHDRPHPNSQHAFGDTYLKHREALEFSVDQHEYLMGFAQGLGMAAGVSVWDLTSAKEMIDIGYDFIKIPSAANLNFGLIDYVARNHSGLIHISLGMTTNTQRQEIMDYIADRKDKFIVYHTTTEYPCPFERLYLLEILNILKQGFIAGFSGHNYGISVDVSAFSLGAIWIERHFSLDRTAKGTDQAASLESTGMQKLIRDLKATYLALQNKPDDMTDMEKEASGKLRVTM